MFAFKIRERNICDSEFNIWGFKILLKRPSSPFLFVAWMRETVPLDLTFRSNEWKDRKAAGDHSEVLLCAFRQVTNESLSLVRLT